nr:hypothetical protein [Pseudodesulfovibrio sp.]
MIFRRDPIPGTGRCRSNFYKRPKSHQERRLSLAYPKLVHTRRKAKTLPNAWNDISRSNAIDRCWKRNKKRRKQWMR